jgi:hypothetical protein
MAEQDVKYMGITVSVEDRKFHKDFGKQGKFSVQIPLPYEKSSIMAACSRAIGGNNASSLPVNDYEYVRMLVTLNTVVVDSPPWWEGADKCPDDTFLNEIWRWYLSCEEEFTARMKTKTKSEVLEKS